MRIEKVNSVIQKELSKILLEDFDFAPGTLVTILAVDTASNLESTKIWISVLPENMAQKILTQLTGEIGEIQKRLNRRVSLRFVPRITFKIDRSEAYAAHIDRVLGNR